MMNATDDVAIDFGDQQVPQKAIKHPIAIFFHLAFRITAVVVYIFCAFFSDSFVVNFIVLIILLSADFWTVKNVTGRLLVGLRWWNFVDENGKSHWIYEGKKGEQATRISPAESRIFWIGLIASPVLWLLFFFGTIFTLSLKWLIVVCVALGFNVANLYGYIRCKIGAKKGLSTAATEFLGQQAFRSFLSRATNQQPQQQQQPRQAVPQEPPSNM